MLLSALVSWWVSMAIYHFMVVVVSVVKFQAFWQLKVKILQKDIMKSGKTNKQVQGLQKGEILNKTCSVNFAEFSLLEVIPKVLQTLTV